MLISYEIDAFIKNKENNGALLITGQWGCGKSYLIKNCVDNLNKQNAYAISVVSLFGVDSIPTLNTRVRDAYLEFTSAVFGKKAQKVWGTLKKVATDSASITAAALPESVTASAVSMGVSSVLSFNPLNFISVKNTVGQGDKQKKFALVFDDFERCNIDKKDLLGAINEYAENKDIKVIIVADEDKIKDEAYNEFKEKVVSRTLQMSSDYPEIINSIIDKYQTANKDYKLFLEKHKDCIIGSFTHSGYNNLRTLKSCLIDFERIFEAWTDAGIPLDKLEMLFYKFCVITYEAKKGLYAPGPYGMYTIVTKEDDPKKRDAKVKAIKEKYLDGSFEYIPERISRWVIYGEWNKESCQQELRRMFLQDEISHEERFILYHFWDLEQADIDIGMPALIAKAYNGEASRDELIALLQKVHAMKKYDVSLPCEVDYQKLNSGFDERSLKVKNGDIQEPKKRTFTDNDQIDTEAIPLNAKIEKMGTLMYVWENRRLLISYLQNPETTTYYKLNNLCIEAFDNELYQLFIKKYTSALNGDKRELSLMLLNLDFFNSHYATPDDQNVTLNSFHALIDELANLCTTSSDGLCTAIHKQFISMLENKIKEVDGSDE